MRLSSTFHNVKRNDIINSVNRLILSERVRSEYPLRVKFEGEIGFDTGGVCRDMFSGYWEECFKRYFDGNSILAPIVHPGIDMLSLPALGTVLSHGFIVSGFMPTRIAFATLASILLGVRAEVSSHILVETFADSLNPLERSTVKQALDASDEQFSESVLQKLIAILCRYGCRESPKPTTLKRQLVSIARFEFQIKPLAAISAISSGE